ncbi:MAG: hypothetical protein JPMHGGIA_00950 [Saprospiraceae bacterium]|jgi:hypothetical protein|nr:hypothetical protein [Saprospiraceae bacterium]
MKAIIYILFLFFASDLRGQDIIIQPPIIPPFGCTGFYTLFTGSVTNFSSADFHTFLYGEINYTNEQGNSIKLAEILFRNKPAIIFSKGVTLITNSNFEFIYPDRRIVFFDKELEDIINQSKCLPAGEYDLCLALYTEKGGEIIKPTENFLSQTCFTVSKENNSNLFLVSPMDESEMESLIPLFTWTPVSPFHERAYYTLQIVELIDNQTPWDAFQSNPIVFETSNLKTNIMLYPLAARPFNKCKTYAWRVQYSLKEGFGNPGFRKPSPIYQESEIWTFKTPCKEEEKLARTASPLEWPVYYLTSSSNSGNYHSVKGEMLRIIVDNPYKEQTQLSYVLMDAKEILASASSNAALNEIIPNAYPSLPLKEDYGENKFIISLPSSIQLNKPYLLVINGLKEKHYLRFIRK